MHLTHESGQRYLSWTGSGVGKAFASRLADQYTTPTVHLPHSTAQATRALPVYDR